MMNARAKHSVLVGPNGKQAGRKDQARIAHQMLCVELNSSGKGGGITTLLLPRSTGEKKSWKRYNVEVTTSKRSRFVLIKETIFVTRSQTHCWYI